jgi:hypothetical protein
VACGSSQAAPPEHAETKQPRREQSHCHRLRDSLDISQVDDSIEEVTDTRKRLVLPEEQVLRCNTVRRVVPQNDQMIFTAGVSSGSLK